MYSTRSVVDASTDWVCKISPVSVEMNLKVTLMLRLEDCSKERYSTGRYFVS